MLTRYYSQNLQFDRTNNLKNMNLLKWFIHVKKRIKEKKKEKEDYLIRRFCVIMMKANNGDFSGYNRLTTTSTRVFQAICI